MSPERPEEPHTIPEFRRPVAPGDSPVPESMPGDADTTGDHHPQGPAETVAQVGRPTVLDDPEWPVIPEYPITGEIARGGMGVVYAARDTSLDREVAVKTLLPLKPGSLPRSPAELERDAAQFAREARITARLPHPGVPPVHALGRLADDRPFLAMKLIKGRTLAAELSAIDWVADIPRLLGIFEQICQTVGYAHSVGIIHRDLKPGNVMVGAFGEVQVMDWGLARQIHSAVVDDAGGPAAARSAPGDTDATVLGRAKGTPAFMPPEQARGAWDEVDARADVFALGCVLCVILTGKPPYTGANARAIHTRAAEADLDEAFARLDGSGADAELVALCKRCLAPKPADRPADGKAVAEAVAAYRAGVEERARKAETERAAAEAEAREQRKRRKVQVALIGVLALFLAAGGAFAWWQELENANQARLEGDKSAADARADSERKVRAEQVRQRVTADIAQAAVSRKRFRFADAKSVLEDAAKHLESGDADELRPGLAAAQAELEFVREVDDIRYGSTARNTQTGFSPLGERYKAAFLGYGIDPLNADAATTLTNVSRLKKSPIRDDLFDALQDWAWDASIEGEAEGAVSRMFGLMLVADQSEWKQRYYRYLEKRDPETGRMLSADAKPDELTPRSVLLLARVLESSGQSQDAWSLLERACASQPNDFHLNYALGRLHKNRPNAVRSAASLTKALAYLRAAQATRPDHPRLAQELTTLLWVDLKDPALKDHPAALREAERWARLEPDFDFAHRAVSALRSSTGDSRGAVVAAFAAVRASPQGLPNHIVLANRIAKVDDPTLAQPMYLQAARLAAQAASDNAPNPVSDQMREELRTHTLRWLNAELATADSDAARTARTGLLTDPDFAFVRDPDNLAALPAVERAEWEQFWSRLRTSLEPAIPAAPPPREVMR